MAQMADFLTYSSYRKMYCDIKSSKNDSKHIVVIESPDEVNRKADKKKFSWNIFGKVKKIIHKVFKNTPTKHLIIPCDTF